MKEYAKKVIDTAILAGQIMLECNAESYRVEETMNYILSITKFETCEAFAMATGVFVTLDDECIDSMTEIRRVPNRDTNLNRIYQVNMISRKLVANDISVEEAYTTLKNLNRPAYSPLAKNIGVILMCGLYAALYGGTLLEMFAAGLSAFLLPLFYWLDQKLNLGLFITNVFSISVLVITLLFFKTYLFHHLNTDIAIIGSIMPAVPGTAITNAVRDTLRGDYNSGVARATEAFVIALSVAIGVAIGLFIGGKII